MKICTFSAGSEKSFIEMILSLVFQLIGKKLFHLCFVDEEQFLKLDNSLFDPDQWNSVYWRSFDNLLKYAHERDIIVQIELWDPHDWYWREHGWDARSFNSVHRVHRI